MSMSGKTTAPPIELELKLKSRVREWWEALLPRLAIPVVDLLMLAYLWAIGTCLFSLVRYGEEAYLLVPWWWMLLGVVEGAALWESFAISVGMRLLGRELRRADGSPPMMHQRLLHWLSWHLFPLAVLTVSLRYLRPGYPSLALAPQELLSGLVYAGADGSALSRALEEPRPWWRTSWGAVLLLAVILTLGAGLGITRANLVALITGAPKVAKFWRALASPDTSLFALGVRLIFETVFMALMATVFAVVVAVPMSFLAARNLMRGPIGRPIYTVIRVAASLTRSVDAIIWAIIFAVWVGMGSFAGALALWVHSIVDLIKLYSEQLESIDPGPVEAITATGANRLQVIRYGIIPQIINPYLSFTLYRWDINVRMATVVGVVGGGGIGWRLFAHLKSWQFPQASMLTLLVIALVWSIDYLSSRLRAKLE